MSTARRPRRGQPNPEDHAAIDQTRRMDDAARVSEMIVDSAIALVQSQLAAADSLDAKAVGVLAVAGIAITVVLSNAGAWGRVWWVPIFGAVEVSISALGVLIPRGFDPGPRAGEFYNRFGGATPAAAAAQMVAEWNASYDKNLTPILWKERWLTASLALAAGTFAFSALSFYLWR